jgi:hypothetical protein
MKKFIFDGSNRRPFRRYDYDSLKPALESVPIFKGKKFPLKLIQRKDKPPEKWAGKIYPIKKIRNDEP